MRVYKQFRDSIIPWSYFHILDAVLFFLGWQSWSTISFRELKFILSPRCNWFCKKHDVIYLLLRWVYILLFLFILSFLWGFLSCSKLAKLIVWVLNMLLRSSDTNWRSICWVSVFVSRMNLRMRFLVTAGLWCELKFWHLFVESVFPYYIVGVANKTISFYIITFLDILSGKHFQQFVVLCIYLLLVTVALGKKCKHIYITVRCILKKYGLHKFHEAAFVFIYKIERAKNVYFLE